MVCDAPMKIVNSPCFGGNAITWNAWRKFQILLINLYTEGCKSTTLVLLVVTTQRVS